MLRNKLTMFFRCKPGQQPGFLISCQVFLLHWTLALQTHRKFPMQNLLSFFRYHKGEGQTILSKPIDFADIIKRYYDYPILKWRFRNLPLLHDCQAIKRVTSIPASRLLIPIFLAGSVGLILSLKYQILIFMAWLSTFYKHLRLLLYLVNI